MTTYEQWQKWANDFTMLPYVQKFPLAEDRLSTWEGAWLFGEQQPAFVLESGKGGRYSFFGAGPFSLIKGKGDQAVVHSFSPHRSAKTVSGHPLRIIQDWMRPFCSPRMEGVPKFIGGCVGYLSYDMARLLEKLPVMAEDDLKLPDFYLMMMDKLWIVDHRDQALFCAVHVPLSLGGNNADLPTLYRQASETAKRMKRIWEQRIADERTKENGLRRMERYDQKLREDSWDIDMEAIPGISKHFSKTDFIEAAYKIQDYIRQGDVFQVNLSVRQSRKLSSSAEEVYEWLRLVNPSPYMALLRFPDFQLVSASPELLVKLEGSKVETRPIAGTRPRGDDAAEDLKLAAELIENEKERAEHIMLVDLLRNDLGRFSRFGSVKVTDFMTIEYYSHVMHIVSHVQGELAEGKNAYDVIAGVFPGGTITGAPKIRTMEIIEELEPVRRGPYTGSIGWIDYNGNMELNITIRTLLISGETGYVQAGAGIVIDSLPEKEYAESLNKAKALWKAVQYAEGDNR